MLVDALIKSRGGTVPAELGEPLVRSLPRTLDRAEDFARWAPHIRQLVLLFDLLGGLRFSVAGVVARLEHVSFNRTGTSARLLPIAEIKRPALAVFKGQAKLVAGYAELRAERASEILAQLTPQWAFWNSAANLRLDQRPRTQELMSLALSLASIIEMRFKHALACPRPSDYLPRIQPIIPVPLHGSLPSGHATEAFIVAHLLTQLRAEGHRFVDDLQRLAERTSINRSVAGVHFPIDSEAGRLLGTSLGEYLVCLCRRDSAAPAGSWQARTFETRDPGFDFVVPGAPLLPGTRQADPQHPTAAAPTTALQWLWRQAAAEWR